MAKPVDFLRICAEIFFVTQFVSPIAVTYNSHPMKQEFLIFRAYPNNLILPIYSIFLIGELAVNQKKKIVYGLG